MCAVRHSFLTLLLTLRSLIGGCVATAAALAIGVATLVPVAGEPNAPAGCLICGSLGGVDAVLNIVLFVPLGIGLALAGLRARSAIAAMCAFTILIELLQATVIHGRYGSAADVITNSLGGMLGFVSGLYGHLALRPTVARARVLACTWAVVWFTVQVLVALSFVPAPGEPPYYGHVRRPHWSSGLVFNGDVVGATLASVPVRPGELPDGERMRAEYRGRDGAPFTAIVAPAGAPEGRREIVVVAGVRGGIGSFEQQNADLVWGARTGADVLRLRPFWFRMTDVFVLPADGSPHDTLRIIARYGQEEAVLTVMSAGVHRQRHFAHRLSKGWVLVMPFDVELDEDVSELLVGAAFMALLLIPAGYWGSTAVGSSGRATVARGLAGLATLLALGLILTPSLLGLRNAAIWEWACCMAGVFAGALIARSGGSAKA